jgi:hypothetical protein
MRSAPHISQKARLASWGVRQSGFGQGIEVAGIVTDGPVATEPFPAEPIAARLLAAMIGTTGWKH